MHCICEAKGPDHMYENRNTKFNLLCPVCIVPNGGEKKKRKKNQYLCYEMMG